MTEVTKSSITLKSSDGFTKRYVVNGDTIVHGDEGGIGSVAKSEDVVVTALHDGGNPTAGGARTAVQQRRQAAWSSSGSYPPGPPGRVTANPDGPGSRS